ncbi:MAG TPA: Gfo/Idh/MocA family oxidoreductase [Gaiellales bacterium]|jgi:predicted dehydrogenase|nr:Gfo/Idh/MocA family oxidoreductase [Gaiellales bacterium]
MRLPLRVGLIGCGNVALSDHVPFYLSRPDLYRVVAIADPTPARRALARTQIGLEPADVYEAAHGLLVREDIDVIDVCTPQHVRLPLILEALERHRHVISEKPLATTPADAAILVAAAERNDVHIALMHNYLFMPEVASALDVVRTGEIGDVEVAIINFLGVLDLPGNSAWAPRWRHDLAAAGGGVLVDMLHAVYVAEAFLGRPIERVSGWVYARAEGAPVEDIALCRFETDVNAALVNVGWGVGPGGIEVSGSRGRIAVRYRDGGTGPFDPLEQVTVTAEGETRAISVAEYNDGVAGVLLDLATAIVGGRPPLASGADGLRTLEATLAVYASAYRGVTVTLPLDAADPVHRAGVLGLADLPAAAWSPVRSRRLFSAVAGEPGPTS